MELPLVLFLAVQIFHLMVSPPPLSIHTLSCGTISNQGAYYLHVPSPRRSAHSQIPNNFSFRLLAIEFFFKTFCFTSDPVVPVYKLT